MTKTRCFICQSNYTTHMSGVCHDCSNGEVPDILKEKRTVFWGKELSKKDKCEVYKKQSESKLKQSKPGLLNSRKARKEKTDRRCWSVLVQKTEEMGEWTQFDIIPEFNQKLSRYHYAICTFRPYLENRRNSRKWFWKVKDEYLYKDFDEIKQDGA